LTRRSRTRGNGEGSILHRPERPSPWVAVVITGWTAEGRPIRRSRYASSERAAKKLLAAMLEAKNAGDPLPDDRLTTGTFVRGWMQRQQTRVRPTTMRTYDFQAEHLILPHVGSIPLRRLRASHVEAMMAAHASLSPHTVAGARSLLRRILADAERDRLISHNPAALARGQVAMPRRIEAPSVASVNAVLDALTSHRLYALFVLDALTGLRLGEVSGLRWGDLDGATLHVRVQLQITRDPEEPFVLTELKTAQARREIRLAPSAVEALRVHRLRQAEDRLAAGQGWRNVSDLIFTNAEGEPLHPNTIRWVLAQGIAAAGVLAFPCHSFRRFVATVVGGSGDMAAAQALLGHRAETLTADVYVSKTDAAMQRAAEVMEAVMGR
jgi:integrase